MKTYKLVMITLCVVGVGCKEGGQTVGDRVIEGNLPSIISEGDCGYIIPPVGPDVWAYSTDAIVWGIIRDIQLVYEPAWVSGIGLGNDNMIFVSKDECLESEEYVAFLYPAIDITVEVEEVLFGNAPYNLTVRVGHEEVFYWNPSPMEKDGQLAWSGKGCNDCIQSECNVSQCGNLVIGQHIGMALHYDDTHWNLWGLMGELMFVFGENGLIFQRIANDDMECYPATPVEGLDGMSLNDLKDLLSQYDDPSEEILTTAQNRKTRILNHGQIKLKNYMLATCLWMNRDPDPECQSDDDCPDINKHSCVNGVCQ